MTLVELGEDFWAKVDRSDPSGCWVWTGAKSWGYGCYSAKGVKTRRAHRVAYLALVGAIPDGLVLDHLCRVKACVNPAHLEPVTQRENVLRGDGAKPQTHCKYGHPLTPGNTYVRYSPGSQTEKRRDCRTCVRAKRSRYKARHRTGPRASSLAAEDMRQKVLVYLESRGPSSFADLRAGMEGGYDTGMFRRIDRALQTLKQLGKVDLLRGSGAPKWRAADAREAKGHD